MIEQVSFGRVPLRMPLSSAFAYSRVARDTPATVKKDNGFQFPTTGLLSRQIMPSSTSGLPVIRPGSMLAWRSLPTSQPPNYQSERSQLPIADSGLQGVVQLVRTPTRHVGGCGFEPPFFCCEHFGEVQTASGIRILCHAVRRASSRS
jgi:hypothetical protein